MYRLQATWTQIRVQEGWALNRWTVAAFLFAIEVFVEVLSLSEDKTGERLQ